MAIRFDSNTNGLYSDKQGNNLVPRAVVVIGKTTVIPLSYTLNMHYEFDTDTCTITFPMDLLDISSIYTESLKTGNVIPIELWSGYIDTREPHLSTFDFTEDTAYKTNSQLVDDLLVDYQELLTRRWVGIMGQPELSYGSIESSDEIRLFCYDYSIILKRFNYEEEFKDSDSRVDRILDKLNGSLKNFKFELDTTMETKDLDKIRGTLMGYDVDYTKDGETSSTKEINYNTNGKSYYQILKDICDRTRTTIVIDYNKIIEQNKLVYTITKRKSSDRGWRLFRNKHFIELSIRAGGYNSVASPKIAVECFSTDTKSGKTVKGAFPVNLTKESPEGQTYLTYRLENDLTTEQLKARAFDIANNLARKDITGDLFLPNAIVNLYPKQIITLNDGTDLVRNRSIQQYADYNFVVSSISEEFSLDGNGLTQKVEFELDMTTNAINADGTTKAIQIFKQEVNNDTKKGGKIKGLSPSQSIEIIEQNKVPSYLQRLRNKGLF